MKVAEKVREAFPEEAEYYRILFLDGYEKDMKFGAYRIRPKVNSAPDDEYPVLKSEFSSVSDKSREIKEVWERTFLKASRRHPIMGEERHDAYCDLAAKVTRVFVQEGVIKKL